LETSREKQKERQWPLRIKQLAQTVAKVKFCRKKLAENTGSVHNVKKLLTIEPQDA
jgi:hypothetical protein